MIIRVLTISDVLIIGSFGLIAPIFAIFITDKIPGGTVEVAGIASAIYLLTKSFGQIPMATFIDKIKGEKDDFWVMFTSSIVFAIIPLLYIIIDTPGQLYLIQFVSGLSSAFCFPAWRGIFTRHIDKKHEGLEWSVYQTLVDITSAATASIGGFVALKYGFDTLFIAMSVITFAGVIILLSIYHRMLPD